MTILLCGLLVTGLANAECPASLNQDELIKCQGIEKTGANYQQWLEESAMTDEETTSPVTGQDIKTIAPAAGQAESESDAK
ncbi:MAG: hypothetical protein OEY87_06280 [Gammaproteobacteria bacterium]|nr:hypothetical protein [Gammaproteobacteria bacterium]MDH5735713.1 hypothetical protein [Gammaproteobacteria bacterium]